MEKLLLNQTPTRVPQKVLSIKTTRKFLIYWIGQTVKEVFLMKNCGSVLDYKQNGLVVFFFKKAAPIAPPFLYCFYQKLSAEKCSKNGQALLPGAVHP